jgi:predicted Zn-dependent protease
LYRFFSITQIIALVLGLAYAAAPNVVVLSPYALTLQRCELAFVVGHELVHIAQQHFDQEAAAVLALSHMPVTWTDRGTDAMQLADGDFDLALELSDLHQEQEREADWLGALLAAQACGCSMDKGAFSFLRRNEHAGGGLAAAHEINSERIRDLRPFADAARRLITGMAH